MDRRRSRRFDLHVPAICRSKNLQASHQLVGFTRDVSSGGVFILSRVTLAEGTRVDLDVILPPLEAGQKEMKLQCEAIVVRVEREGATTGFAVSNLERGYVLSHLDEALTHFPDAAEQTR